MPTSVIKGTVGRSSKLTDIPVSIVVHCYIKYVLNISAFPVTCTKVLFSIRGGGGIGIVLTLFKNVFIRE